MPAALSIANRAGQRDPKRQRPALPRLYLSFWKRLTFLGGPTISLIRRMERWFGPRCLPALLTPIIWMDVARRLADYREFKKLRRILPDDFWQELSPWRHFVRMIENWDSTLAAAFLCDRLDEPAWRKRIQVAGTRPDALPESRGRPVLLVHLHTGAYGMLPYWLRAQRLEAACIWGGTPTLFRSSWAVRIFKHADRIHGLSEVPQILMPRQLREIRHFLVPGHFLTVAIDADSASAAPFDLCGGEIVLSEGLIHLAESTQSLVVPVSILTRGICRYEIRFGEPVPDAMINRRNPKPAVRFILDQLWNDVEKDPGLVSWSTLLAIDSRSKPLHIPWP